MKKFIAAISIFASSLAFAGAPTYFNDVSVANSQKIGGSGFANSKAALEISSITKGFLPPKMTLTQRNAITSPPAGLMLYNLSSNYMDYFNGTVWRELSSLDGAETLSNKTLTSPVLNLGDFVNASAPSTPPSGHVYVYSKSDKILYFKNDTGTEYSAAGGGGAVTVANVGSGAGIYKDLTGTTFNFKSLTAGSGITLTPGTDDITIAATGGGGSGANQQLSNLDAGNVAINTDLIWGTNVTGLLKTKDLNSIGGGPPLTIETGDNFSGPTGAIVVASGNAAASSGAATFGSGPGGNASGLTKITSGDAGGFPSGNTLITTGVGGNGFGTSGSVILSPNSNAATRGHIKFQDGSEGTSGYVWTSTTTDGTGAWAAPGGGGFDPTDITDNLTGNTGLGWLIHTKDQSSGVTEDISIASGTSNDDYAGNVVLYPGIGHDVTPIDTPEIQVISLSAVPTGGTGGFLVDDTHTINLNPHDSNSTIQAAFDAEFGSGAISVGGDLDSQVVTLTFNTLNGSYSLTNLVNNSFTPSTVNSTSRLQTGVYVYQDRAKIQFKDGSEGTSGDIWTSSNTIGAGHWVHNPLNPSAIATDLVPDGDGSREFGSSADAWGTVYTYGLENDNGDISGYANGDMSFESETTMTLQNDTTNNKIELLNSGITKFTGAQVQSNSGFSLITTAGQPTCDSTHRGETWIVRGDGSSTSDEYQVCEFLAPSSTYTWVAPIASTFSNLPAGDTTIHSTGVFQLIGDTEFDIAGPASSISLLSSGVTEMAGIVQSDNGIKLRTTGGQPTCDSTSRGILWVIQGIPDELQLCMRDSGGGFQWVSIVVAP